MKPNGKYFVVRAVFFVVCAVGLLSALGNAEPRMEPSNCQPKLAGESFCSRPANTNSLSTTTLPEGSLSFDPENQDGAG